MDRVPKFEIEGNWGGDSIMGEAFALVSGLFTTAELENGLVWQLNSLV